MRLLTSREISDVAGGKIGEATMQAMRGVVGEQRLTLANDHAAAHDSGGSVEGAGDMIPDLPSRPRPGPCGADRICQFFQ